MQARSLIEIFPSTPGTQCSESNSDSETSCCQDSQDSQDFYTVSLELNEQLKVFSCMDRMAFSFNKKTN